MSGIFTGIGVGPGDPELLTLKACRLIAAADLVAYPVNAEGDSQARSIAAAHIAEASDELPIHIPMATDRAPARTAYDTAADDIAAALADGRDVAFLCEGDPFFYGSFMYLFARISAHHETRVVPGVTSLTACAAALGRPLAARNDLMKVLPAPMDEARLRAELETADAVAIIKVGRHFDKVRRALDDAGLTAASAIVERATHADERITRLADITPGERPYFSTILAYRGGEGWS